MLVFSLFLQKMFLHMRKLLNTIKTKPKVFGYQRYSIARVCVLSKKFIRISIL